MNTIEINNINTTMAHVDDEWLPIIIELASDPDYNTDVGICMCHYWDNGEGWDNDLQAMRLVDNQSMTIGEAWSYYTSYRDEIGMEDLARRYVTLTNELSIRE